MGKRKKFRALNFAMALRPNRHFTHDTTVMQIVMIQNIRRLENPDIEW
jgi:hypothetical protein